MTVKIVMESGSLGAGIVFLMFFVFGMFVGVSLAYIMLRYAATTIQG
jgi:hypothetical protein